MTSSELQTGESRNRGLGNALADPEVDNEKTSRQRVKARISTSTKLPGTDRITPPLVTPLVDNGAALEEALNNIEDSLGEQNEQMSIRMSELERAVHIERERAVHQAMPQGVMEHGVRTVEQVQRGTDRPLINDQRTAHTRLGEVSPETGGMQARGGVMWAKRETLTAIRIAGMHRIQSL